MLLKLLYLSSALMVVLLTTKIYAIAADLPQSTSTKQIASSSEAQLSVSKTSSVTVPETAKDASEANNMCAQGGCAGPAITENFSKAPPPVSNTTIGSSNDTLTQDLVARKEELDQEEAKIKEQQRLIEAANGALQSRISILEQQQNQLVETQKNTIALTHEDSDRLVQIYETMRPQDAAAIFNVLDLRIGVPLLKKMNPRKTSAIMALMTPQRAILATQLLASESGTQGNRR